MLNSPVMMVDDLRAILLTFHQASLERSPPKLATTVVKLRSFVDHGIVHQLNRNALETFSVALDTALSELTWYTKGVHRRFVRGAIIAVPTLLGTSCIIRFVGLSMIVSWTLTALVMLEITYLGYCLRRLMDAREMNDDVVTPLSSIVTDVRTALHQRDKEPSALNQSADSASDIDGVSAAEESSETNEGSLSIANALRRPGTVSAAAANNRRGAKKPRTSELGTSEVRGGELVKLAAGFRNTEPG